MSTGYDFLKGVIEVALGMFTEPVMMESHCSGVYFLSKETEKLKEVIWKREQYPEIIRAEITDSELKHIECSGDRSGYLIYQSNKKFIPRI